MNSKRRAVAATFFAAVTAVTSVTAVSAADKAEKKTEKKKEVKGPALPKAGLKTPGILIPVSTLQPEADIALDSPATGIQFNDAALIATGAGLHRIESRTNKPAEPPVVVKLDQPCGGVINAFSFFWTPVCGSQSLAKIESRGGAGGGPGGRGGFGGGPGGRRGGGPGGPPPAEGAKPDAAKPPAEAKAEDVKPKEEAKPDATKMADGAKPPADAKPVAGEKPRGGGGGGPRPVTMSLSTSIPAGKPVAPLAIAASEDSLWILADGKTTLQRIDPKENTIVGELRLGPNCTSILPADSSIWVTCPGENRVIRIDPKTSLVSKRVEVADEPVALAFGEGSLWVLGRKEGKISRVDPKTNKTIATIDLGIPGASSGSLAFGDGALWASLPGFPVIRISPTAEKEKVMQEFYGDGGGGVITFGLGSVWVASPGVNTVKRYDPKRIIATLAE